MLVELLEKYRKPYIDKGYAQGKIAGEVQGMAAIIKEMLIQKFGSMHPDWDLAISNLDDPKKVMDLYRLLSSTKNQDEVNKALKL